VDQPGSPLEMLGLKNLDRRLFPGNSEH
jgi:hypothetical protein